VGAESWLRWWRKGDEERVVARKSKREKKEEPKKKGSMETPKNGTIALLLATNR